MPIIALVQKRLRGKGAAANLIRFLLTDGRYKPGAGIQREEDPQVRIIAFADSLKEGIGKHIFGLTAEQLHGEYKAIVDPFWGLTPRTIMQRAGTEAMRHAFGEEIWVKSLERKLVRPEDIFYIIEDMRFLSEARLVEKYQGISIRIDRQIAWDADIDMHCSETELDAYPFTYHVDNNGSIDELKESLRNIIEPFYCDWLDQREARRNL